MEHSQIERLIYRIQIRDRIATHVSENNECLIALFRIAWENQSSNKESFPINILCNWCLTFSKECKLEPYFYEIFQNPQKLGRSIHKNLQYLGLKSADRKNNRAYYKVMPRDITDSDKTEVMTTDEAYFIIQNHLKRINTNVNAPTPSKISLEIKASKA